MVKYTEEQLNTCSNEMLITMLLSMPDQMEQLNQNFEKLLEQLADVKNHRYGRPPEKRSVIDGQLPDEIYKRVRVQSAVYTVEIHHVAVYAGKDNQTIVKADRPKSLLRNSIVTPSFGVGIMNAKYTNGLYLYRISQEFQRNDIHISC